MCGLNVGVSEVVPAEMTGENVVYDGDDRFGREEKICHVVKARLEEGVAGLPRLEHGYLSQTQELSGIVDRDRRPGEVLGPLLPAIHRLGKKRCRPLSRSVRLVGRAEWSTTGWRRSPHHETRDVNE